MSVGDRSRRQHKDKNYFAKKNTLWSIVDANFGKKLLEINLERYFYYLKFGGLRPRPYASAPRNAGIGRVSSRRRRVPRPWRAGVAR